IRMCCCWLCCLSRLACLRLLHSFPTRRSSDLVHLPLPEPGHGRVWQPLADLARREDDLTAMVRLVGHEVGAHVGDVEGKVTPDVDRKSTRLNSSHDQTSYAVFCLKKKTPPRSR